MKLPIPARVAGTVYTEAEIQAPTVDNVTETRAIADKGKMFAAMRPFMVGCILSFRKEDGQEIDDPISIKSIVPKLPYKSVEYLTTNALLLANNEDGIEGIYPCPRCGTEVIAEYRDEDGVIIDTRDFIKNFPVRYFDANKNSYEITIELTNPVIIGGKKNSGEDPVLDVRSIGVEIPTLENFIVAESKVQGNDPVKIQLAAYVEAMKTVNGEVVDNAFKNQFGMAIFGNIRSIKQDLGRLAEEINKFGIMRQVQKTCPRCKKVWNVQPNTSNFFEYAPLSY